MPWIEITQDVEIIVTPRYHRLYRAGEVLNLPREVADTILARKSGKAVKAPVTK